MARTAQVQAVREAIPRWEIQCNYVEACNCAYGCPCNFSGFPTFGACRALVLYHIMQGHAGATRLDGLSVVYAAAWPKAIHQGDGTLQLYVSQRANDAQRKAIFTIFVGKAKGTGPFAVFGPMLRYILEPQFVDVQVHIEGKHSGFAVPGILQVEVAPFIHPVTGAEQETEVHLPKGFIWRAAEACKTKVMRIVSPHLSYDESGQNAFFCRSLTFRGP